MHDFAYVRFDREGRTLDASRGLVGQDSCSRIRPLCGVPAFRRCDRPRDRICMRMSTGPGASWIPSFGPKPGTWGIRGSHRSGHGRSWSPTHVPRRGRMSPTVKSLLKKTMFFPPVVVGALVVFALVRSAKDPSMRPYAEESRAVRVITIRPVDLVPCVECYGIVRPQKVWRLIPQVSGRVVSISPDFHKGSMLLEGAEILVIDDSALKLEKSRLASSMASADVELEELSANAQNTQDSLALETRMCELMKDEVERQTSLVEQKRISVSEFERIRREYLLLEIRVQSLQNSLRLIPMRRKALLQKRAQIAIQLEQVELDLSYTRITAPFDCRVADEDIEISQYVQRGQVLAVCDGIDVAEICAQVRMGSLVRLMDRKGMEFLKSGMPIKERVKEVFGFTVKAKYDSSDLNAVWDAEFEYPTEEIDPKTRTIGIIATVRDHYREARVGVRPPLIKGTFCRVEICGRPKENRIVIPRTALHSGRAYLVGEGRRLRFREVTPDFAQDDFVVLKDGLTPGDVVVVSDLVPAIEGMLLDPVEDEDLAEVLFRQAAGEDR